MSALAFKLLLITTFPAAFLWVSWNTGVASQDKRRINGLPKYSEQVQKSDNGSSIDTAPDLDFPWLSIPPSVNLVWHLCYGAFQCARLEVPLNYSEPRGRQAAIALIRKPALFSEGSRFYKGPVLINPGGPGGSGVDVVLRLGNAISTILGPRFDIVGFDPRGISRSTPRSNFFSSDLERELFYTQTPGSPGHENVAYTWARAQLLGGLAARHDDGRLAHFNTANTATDMLMIANAHGRKKLQYWGFSYGSVLGATFAAMYPDNIERMVIDGVMDSEDYYATGWLTNLVDTEKSLDHFFESCAEAGPSRCAFHAPEPSDIKKNLTSLYDRLRKEPLPVLTRSGTYGIVDYGVLRKYIFLSLYSPYNSFPFLAQGLKDLAAGDGGSLLSIFQPPPYKCSCNPHERDLIAVLDGQTTLACNDGDEVSSSLDDLKDYRQKLSNVSDWADAWWQIHASCIGWPKVEKRFRGPFVGNTSHPILVVGNTADPVTPLQSAKKMAEGFRGAVVLTQDSPGHCSINAPSICTQRYIRQYFQDGTLPTPGTVCEPVVKNPFYKVPGRFDAEDQTPLQLGVEPQDAELWNAVLEMSEGLRPSLSEFHLLRGV
ncbi:hypothetical protein D9611_003052 [Ephemerocybe angulata]|uniref:Peptidase S33 tripeptidyl aminopeptidase-like C-terminal domain-containing protein n=1 Tax=Ephemerocybe angulata TaxID=980116 RepID=A0A8H5C9B4_9AGAR|nr:hypothetical protein D9611_003052 [Tulosesus angulatus]